ncbi:hypothetical protein ANCDUO_24482 [Ancylostoma duodenale]|uniref:GST C-terminal domain-containing protein n=1 Tax=Ancylostoma duodenale TaxID=51022 RepID=A0A0C2C763_9BILA|nr:hypothetical protein ANCDUO_24482 [Ancylostoma duodenale]
MYAETFMDFFTIAVERMFEKDPDIKAKKDEKFEKQCPIRLKIFEDHLKKNGGENFVLWYDLVAVAVLSMVEETKADLLQDFPDLRNYYMNMRNLPEIKDYVAQSWPPAATDQTDQADQD